MLDLMLIEALDDNYIYLIRWDNHAAVVDPGSAKPVLEVLQKEMITLDTILLTHHHSDHIGGVDQLVQQYGCRVVGPADERIPQVTHTLGEGESCSFPPLEFEAFSVPGHTSIHLAFYFPAQEWLFTGDSLFLGGCGRLFEGTPEQMHHSLQKYAHLPDETLVLCGHEYTVTNYRFAAELEPENDKVAERLKLAEGMRAEGRPTLPATLGEERATNPFLRTNDPQLRSALGMKEASEVEVFAEIRERRNNF